MKSCKHNCYYGSKTASVFHRKRFYLYNVNFAWKRIFNSWYFNSLHPPRPSHGFSILFSWNLLYCIKHGLYLSDTQLQTSISTIKKCVFLLQELTITATKSSSNLLQTLHISDPCLDLHITWHCCLYPVNIKGKKKILFVELENFTFILSCPSLS